MIPTFTDFLLDTETAKSYRARHPVDALLTKAGPDTSAEAEFNEEYKRRSTRSPGSGMTYQALVGEIFAENSDLARRYRLETTHSVHGGTLQSHIDRARRGVESGQVGFGVDQEGRPVTKADIEADVMRRAAMIVAKSSHGVTMGDAIGAVFQSDRALYEQWRTASRA